MNILTNGLAVLSLIGAVIIIGISYHTMYDPQLSKYKAKITQLWITNALAFIVLLGIFGLTNVLSLETRRLISFATTLILLIVLIFQVYILRDDPE